MKKLLAIAIAAAFAASGAAVAQDKKDVKSAGNSAKAADKSAVTTGGAKPKKDPKGDANVKIEHQGKRKTEAQRMEEEKAKAKK